MMKKEKKVREEFKEEKPPNLKRKDNGKRAKTLERQKKAAVK